MNISLSKFYLGWRERHKLLALVLKYYRFEKKNKKWNCKKPAYYHCDPSKNIHKQAKKDLNSIRKGAQLLQA